MLRVVKWEGVGVLSGGSEAQLLTFCAFGTIVERVDMDGNMWQQLKNKLETLVRMWFERPPKRLILALLGATVVLGGGYVGVTTWIQPLGPELDLPTSTVAPTELAVEQATHTPEPGDTPQPTASPTEPAASPTPTIKPVCGGPPNMMVLVSGVAADNYTYGLADAIRLARVDFQTQKVTVLALPRDLWVSIPGIADHGVKQGKLNQAYFYGTPGMDYYDGPGDGSGLLARTLQENYGLRVDHYLAVNLNSFRQIIDAMGGIDVYLGQDVYRKRFGEPKLFLKAGQRHLNGKKAEILARSRIEIGDYGRINNQTVILKGIMAKMLSPSGIQAIPNLVDRLRSNVVTDYSPSQISQLVCLAEKIDRDRDVTFVTLPSDLTVNKWVYDESRGADTAALVGDEQEIRTLLQEFQAGRWPEDGSP